ncbi:MAG: amidohydrolase family protein [Betaproteobacteria bacterium]|nr:amidohydrolase family protein [Betaproteobacteria bacterium]
MNHSIRAGRAPQPSTAVNFAVPQDACDCHTHIHGEPAEYPFDPARAYTPETALPHEMAALHAALHVRRVVIVTPSVYGTDNSATLYGMRARGGDARGVVVINDDTADGELDAMHAAGVRGLRLNLSTAGIHDPDVAKVALGRALRRAAARGWHVQIFTHPPTIEAVADIVRQAPVPVVFDHFGGAVASAGIGQRGFADLVDLVRTGHAYVKISGAYRSSSLAADFPDIVPFARALIEANADRVLWGTDWPHPSGATPAGRNRLEITPAHPIDDGRLMNQLAIWAPDESLRARILVHNPARLYEF